MSSTDKNVVLVIGNGFDIANGYKTRYSDFLGFIKSQLNNNIQTIKCEESFINEAKSNNFIKHFLAYERQLETWVDVEKEMNRIVNAIKNIYNEDSRHFTIDKTNPNIVRIIDYTEYERIVLTEFSFITNSNPNGFQIPNKRFYSKSYGINWDELNNELDNQLIGLKQLLTSYLRDYMPKLGGGRNILMQLDNINPNLIITFNYTDFYKTYYDIDDVYHVHGSIKDGNIILGYEDDNPKEVKFIKFKKYFQKIQYRIPSINLHDYYSTDQIGQRFKFKSLIYGLSLDKTDSEEIIKIYNNSSEISIYYLNQRDYENKMANLIEIIGKDEVLKDYYSGKIRFELINNN